MKQLVLVFMGLFFTISSSAQSIDDYLSSQKTSSFQKLYLHTDREYYFVGDTLWFSPYLLSANNNKLLADDCNLYVELIDSKGQIIKEKNFVLDKGMCSGYLNFDDKFIGAGTYTLRAYTDWIKPLGENAFFRKTIKISNIRNEDGEGIAHGKGEKVFIDFYPEGGFLLDGQVNQMAFVAHNQDGQKVNLKGELLSDEGVQIPIRTSYKGVGSFIFIPKSGQKYRIEAGGYKRVKFRMPEIHERGAKLRVSKISNKAVTLYITASNNLPSGEFYIALFHRGMGLDYMKIGGKNLSRPLAISTDHLGAGVNRLVLLNAEFEPLSERLVFINKTDEDSPVKIRLGKREYETREQVKMKLSIPEMRNDDTKWARISVSVVNENMTGYMGNSLNIRSYLLLDSELKGQIQTPGWYFIEDDSISSSRKLDLLMLTNGWRNYIWNSINKEGDINFPKEIAAGFTFAGTVQREIAKKPFVGTDVYLNIANKDIRDMKSTKTDARGHFQFEPVVFFDTALVMIQGKNYRGKDNTRTDLINTGVEHFPVTESYYENIKDIGTVSFEMHRLKYMNTMALKEFFPDRESRLLEEVKIVAEKKENPDAHFRLYAMATQSKKLTDRDRNLLNVFQYMDGRFAGVQVKNGNSVVILGRSNGKVSGGTVLSSNVSNDALLLLDGMPVPGEMLKNIPMSDIDLVEVLKGPDAAIFGMRGGNGVVSVFTRTGAEYEPVEEEIPGTIIKKLQGFEKFRVFYSPAYSENSIASKIPDYRQTLYWNPFVTIDGKNQLLSFFTCDNLTNYKIFVEGITSSGKTCLGQASFTVNERRSAK